MNRTFKFEIKSFGDTGTFEGLASTYGNIDLGKDVVDAGAFTKTIEDKGGEFPILWQHDMREPIGLGKVSDSISGLAIKGQLVLDSPVAQKAYALLKAGVLKGLSIGYDVIRDEMKDKIRHLRELKLWEVSLVTFPMNEFATVSGVKSLDELFARISAIEQELKKVQAPEEKEILRAATHDEIAPELLHPISRIEKLLKGEI